MHSIPTETKHITFNIGSTNDQSFVSKHRGHITHTSVFSIYNCTGLEYVVQEMCFWFWNWLNFNSFIWSVCALQKKLKSFICKWIVVIRINSLIKTTMLSMTHQNHTSMYLLLSWQKYGKITNKAFMSCFCFLGLVHMSIITQ
jgi:hypothetical protein